MTDAPERIWKWRSRFKGGVWDAWENGRFGGPPPPFADVEDVPYILATPKALAASPEVQALIAEAVAAERDRCADVDIAAIESENRRWHGEDHRIVSVRWEPYKPDGARQMKAKGRWQEQVGSGDYWRWQNCDRPAAIRRAEGETT